MLLLKTTHKRELDKAGADYLEDFETWHAHVLW